MLTKYIAHALGGYQGHDYTNSKEALEFNYHIRKHRCFEFDVSETSDGKYVLIHDWEKTWRKNFGKKGIPTYQEFISSKMLNDLTPLDLDYLMNWLIKMPDAYLISDIKNHNINILTYIAEKYPQIKERIIPQIYKYEEYHTVKSLGFNNIIMAIYYINIDEQEVINFARENNVIAISMNKEDAQKYQLAKQLANIGIKTYVHTVNDEKEAKTLNEEHYVSGFFTDFL